METHAIIDAFAIHYDTFAGDVYTITDSSLTLTNGSLVVGGTLDSGKHTITTTGGAPMLVLNSSTTNQSRFILTKDAGTPTAYGFSAGAAKSGPVFNEDLLYAISSDTIANIKTGTSGTTRWSVDKNGLITMTGNLIIPDAGNIGSATKNDAIQIEAGGGIVFTKTKLTVLGGFAVKLTNTTGAVTVKGQTVKADPATNDAVILTAAGDNECFGVFLDEDVADDAEAWVVVAGIADVAMADNTAATRGNWVETSQEEAGYANAESASPAAAPRHFNEIGHCIETVAADGEGEHILARCVLHFN